MAIRHRVRGLTQPIDPKDASKAPSAAMQLCDAAKSLPSPDPGHRIGAFRFAYPSIL